MYCTLETRHNVLESCFQLRSRRQAWHEQCQHSHVLLADLLETVHVRAVTCEQNQRLTGFIPSCEPLRDVWKYLIGPMAYSCGD